VVLGRLRDRLVFMHIVQHVARVSLFEAILMVSGKRLVVALLAVAEAFLKSGQGVGLGGESPLVRVVEFPHEVWEGEAAAPAWPAMAQQLHNNAATRNRRARRTACIIFVHYSSAQTKLPSSARVNW
jgi:hypothetical protein